MLFFFVSCNEREEVEKNPIRSSQISFKWNDAVNTDNPYEDDSVGYYHNIGLNYIANEHENYSNDSIFGEDVPEISAEYMCQDFLNNASRSCINFYDSLTDSIIHEYVRDSIDLIQNYNDLSNAFIEHYYDLFNIIDNYDETSGVSNIVDEIIEWETQIDNIANLDTTEERILYYQGQVSRYSLTYWYNEFEGDANEWYFLDSPPHVSKVAFLGINWKQAAKADIGGAVAGAVAAAVTGGGILAGAVGGGLGATSGNMVGQWLDWW